VSKSKQENGNGNGPDLIERLAIRSAPVFVGNCNLTLREPGYGTLIEVGEMLVSEQLAANVKKLTGLVKGAVDGAVVAGETLSKGGLIARYLDAIVDVIREGVLPLIGRQLREVAVILLDTPKNRKVVAEYFVAAGDTRATDEIFLVEIDEDEVESSPSFRRWIRRSITAEQFDHVLEQFQALRGWGELGKRIVTRLGLGSLAIKLTDSPPGSPASPS